MNCSIYVFGNLLGGYTQYPENYTQTIFKNFIQQSSDTKTQVIIHRDKSLMYYGYVRKLDEKVLIGEKNQVEEDAFVGFCILINGMMLTKIGEVFSVFEKAFSELIAEGDIISLNQAGKLTTTAHQLSDRQAQTENIIAFIRQEMNQLDSSSAMLPPLCYSKANDSSRAYNYTDSEEILVTASVQYAYTYIRKDSGYNSFVLEKMMTLLKRKSLMDTTPEVSNPPFPTAPANPPTSTSASTSSNTCSPNSTPPPPPVSQQQRGNTSYPTHADSSLSSQVTPPTKTPVKKNNNGCVIAVIILLLFSVAITFSVISYLVFANNGNENDADISAPHVPSSKKVPVYYDYRMSEEPEDAYIVDTLVMDDYDYTDEYKSEHDDDTDRDSYIDVDTAWFE
ncbi:MAG: hypothetical protein GXY64_04860 [Bacteroidales bacterium]|nr:hypothetical protein [Bacteroidales bacterium]